jgi:hypothetical protein
MTLVPASGINCSRMADSYSCSICGENHEGAPLSWALMHPTCGLTCRRWVERRGEVGTDQAMIDEKHFFIRGRLEIPVTDTADPFAWLVWVEVAVHDFRHMSERWMVEGRETTAPYTGRLANNLDIYSDPTLDLQVKIHTRPVGDRPYIEVLEDDALRREQRDGISSDRVQAIAHILQGESS